ncbi:protein-(glutamine-N5) methyltransferase, release factor-specific [Lysobacteraceae bacterium NML03-0222]|nr:protein-(glutamine-N5) methyltransferase, release factor-specific [Xanthomonadaceae bacterium NML03-0222]
MQIAELLRTAAAQIGREDAEHLLLHLLGKPRSWLFAHDNEMLDKPLVETFQAWLTRRAVGEPVAYITGERGFWTLNLNVSPATLIPRPETELLVELALARWPREAAFSVADLGTGSGAIALAVASERPAAHIIATDASAAALQVARDNAQNHAIGNVEFRHGHWYAPLAGERFDLILSNPPYIEEGDAHLAQGDLRFEPRTALASGMDGLHDLRHIVALAPAHLKAGGWLLLEHGWQQGAAVRALLDAAGFSEVCSVRDLENRERVSLGRWQRKQ